MDKFTPEIIVSFFTVLGMVASIWKIRVDQNANKAKNEQEIAQQRVKHEQDLKNQQAQSVREHDKWEREREKHLQERLEAVQEKYDKRFTQLTQDMQVHLEKRIQAEVIVEQQGQTISMLEKQVGDAVNKAIEEARLSERLKIMNEKVISENKELKAQIDEMKIQIAELPKLEEKIDKLTRQLGDQKRQHTQEMKQLSRLLEERGKEISDELPTTP